MSSSSSSPSSLAWLMEINSISFLKKYYPELLLTIAVFFFLHRCRRRRGPPIDWPIVGMLPGLLSNLPHINDFAFNILEHTGCTFLVKGPWGARMDLLVTADPANINHVFNTNFSNYPKGDEFLEIFDILGGGIFNADNDSWKAQRRMAHGLMAEQRFRRFVVETSWDKVEKGIVPVLEQAAAAGAGDGSVIDLQDVFLRFTFDVTCNLVMGVDPGCLSPGLPAVPFAKAMDDAEEVLFYRHVVPRSWWKIMRWLRVGEERRLAMAWKSIDEFVSKHVSMKKELCKAGEDSSKGSPSPDLMTSYLNGEKTVVEKSDGVDFRSDVFLRDTAVNLLLAGRDTTAAGLSWFFWLVANHPAVEAKILEELKANHVDGNDGGDLSTLVYLHAALTETLRLYPPVPFNHKGALKAEVLPSGHLASPDNKIMFSFYAMGRMEGVWGKDSKEFKPERWISDKGRIRYEPSYKYMSFNSGPRTCLGRDIAFSQMKAVAMTVLSRFHVEVVEGHKVEPKTSIILHMENGLKVRVRKRGDL